MCNKLNSLSFFWASFYVTCFLLLPSNLLVIIVQLLCCFAKHIAQKSWVKSHWVEKKLTNTLALQGVHCGQGTSIWVVVLLTILYLRHLFFFSTCCFNAKTPHKPILFCNLPVLPHQSTAWPFGLQGGNLDQDYLLPSQPEEQPSQLDAQAGKQTKAQLDRPLRGLPIK